MRLFIAAFALLSLSACSKVELASHVAKQVYQSPQETHKGYFKVGTPYRIEGRKYYPKENYDLVETGMASWYGPNFHGKMTANGEIFNQNELTAAHRTLQIPSIARVTNLRNGRSIVVRINDRGPYSKGRVLDLSKRSAEMLGFKNQGTTKVRIEVLREPSLEVARISKNGESTRGFEVALNDGSYMPRTQIAQAPQTQPTQKPVLQQARLESIQPSAGPVQSQQLSRPLIAEPAEKVLIQAGSFSGEGNAMNFAKRIQGVTQSEIQIQTVQLGDKEFFRVQIPAQNMDEASNMVHRLKMAGYDQNLLIQE